MRTLIVAVSATAIALVAGCSSNDPGPTNESADRPSGTSTSSAPLTTAEQKQAPVSAFAQVVGDLRIDRYG